MSAMVMASWFFAQPSQIEENIKALRHCPCDRWRNNPEDMGKNDQSQTTTKFDKREACV